MGVLLNRRRGMGCVSAPEVIIMTEQTNPAVMAICYAQGWAAHADYMTKSEAEAVTNIGTAFQNNTSITSFNELRYFTGFKNNSSAAFQGCTNLGEITIPSTLAGIYGNWFRYCTSLLTVNVVDLYNYLRINTGSQYRIPTCYGARLYYNGAEVTEVTMDTVQAYALYNCPSIQKVTIQSNVKNIGASAFNGCTSLTSITVDRTTPPTLGSGALDNTNGCPIYVPSASVSSYQTATNWSAYASRIQAIPA